MEISVDLRMAELLCSRLCHDLASPVNSVNAGLEAMAEDSGVPPEEARALAAREAAVLTRRLTLFRFALGLGGAPSVPVPGEELKDLCALAAQTRKAEIAWRANDPDSWPRPAARLLVNMVLLAVESLPRGGLVTIDSALLDDGLGIAVAADGPQAGLRPETAAALSPDADVADMDARIIQAHYAAVMAKRLNAAIEVGIEEGQSVALACILP